MIIRAWLTLLRFGQFDHSGMCVPLAGGECSHGGLGSGGSPYVVGSLDVHRLVDMFINLPHGGHKVGV